MEKGMNLARQGFRAGGLFLLVLPLVQAAQPLPLPPPPRPAVASASTTGGEPASTVPLHVPVTRAAIADKESGAILQGRLFFTPARRQVLNRMRERNSLENRIKLEPDTIITLNGVVQRSNGKRTVWVNGLPLTEGQELTDLQIRRVQGNRVELLPGNAPAAELKVGQTLERGSGLREDVLKGGEVIVHAPGSSDLRRHGPATR